AVLTIKKASIGFGGKSKAGFWQPVRLTIVAGAEGARGSLQLVVPDGDQVPVIYSDDTRGAIDLSPGEERTVLLYAKSGPIDSPIDARLVRTDGIVLWQQLLTADAANLRSTQELIVSLGPSLGLDEAAATIRRRGEAAVSTVQVTA